ncbi:MAG: zinc-dependent metalloprotease [Planctomycetota bacterium]|nr:zinc-dependent metalloprotease [Planctomycetota bacterium]
MRTLTVLFCFASLVLAADDKDPKVAARKKAEELLKDADSQKGFLTIHEKDGKVYAELKKADFERDFLCFESISRGVGRGWVVGGLTLGDRILRFKQVSPKQVHVLQQNPRFVADPRSPMERAVKRAYGPSVLAALPVAAKHPDRDTVIVDLGPLFLTDLGDVAENLSESLGVKYSFDADKSNWSRVKVFPRNIEMQVLLAFSGAKYKEVETVPDSRSVQVGMHYSLYRLPKSSGYRPRPADDRVGYFLTALRNFSRPGLSSWVRYCNRWRIDKAEPTAQVSPPRDPLVFWIENTVPHEYRRTVRDGILEWNTAFEKVGIKDAIEVRQMEEDAEWDPEDARYNTFRWITSARLQFGAIGPSRVDPRTGRILDADILFEAENLRGMLWGYTRYMLPRGDARETEPYFLAHEQHLPRFMNGVCNLSVARAPELNFAHTTFMLRAPGKPPPQEYIRQSLKAVVMHEVGHTLGLRHNFKASMMLSMDQLNDTAVTGSKGVIGSIMEYDPVNISRDPSQQGDYFSRVLGPYDFWAIKYGYEPVGADDEAAALALIASRGADPDLRYGTDEDTYGSTNIDPGATIMDLSSDPVAWARDRVGLCEDMWASDWAPLDIEGFGFRLHRSAMRSILSSYRRSLEIAARWVGGTHVRRAHPGDAGGAAPFQNVSLKRQREALDLVLEKGFRAGSLKFSPELLNKLMVNRWRHWGIDAPKDFDYPLNKNIRAMRRALLNRLHSPSVLRHMDEAQERVLPGQPAMTIAEVIGKVSDEIWAGGEKSDGRQRALQADHVEVLARLYLHPQDYPRDAHTLARAQLHKISQVAAQALVGRGVDAATRAHLETVATRIRAVLDVSLSRTVR